MFTSENAAQFGRKGGKATAERHGLEHFREIGKRGFEAHAEKWFGSVQAYKEHLAERCAYNYWSQSGRPAKRDADGRPIFPTHKPVHPSVKSGIPF